MLRVAAIFFFCRFYQFLDFGIYSILLFSIFACVLLLFFMNTCHEFWFFVF